MNGHSSPATFDDNKHKPLNWVSVMSPLAMIGWTEGSDLMPGGHSPSATFDADL